MKKSLLIFPVLLLTILISSCRDKDEKHNFTVSFTMSAEMVNVGQPVTFTNTTSSDVTNFFWDFGDGNNSMEKSPTHTFESQGSFTVVLTGIIDDVEMTTEQVLAVADVQPTASFNLPSLLQTKCPITFLNTSTMAAEYYWDFGDGNTSTMVSPTHTYTTAGTYNITLITKNGTKEAEEDKSVIITEGTSIDIIPETQNTIAFDGLALSDGYLIGTVVNDRTKVYKKDNFGNTVWTKIVSPSTNYQLAQMEILPNGNIAIAATQKSTTGIKNFGWIVIDQEGNLVLDGVQSFGGNQTVNGLFIQNDGSIVIYGQDIYLGNKSGYVICVNSNTGEVKWNKLYEHSTEDEINTGVSNSDGTFILGGTRFDAGSSSNPRSLLLKYDNEGTLLWDKTGDILSQPQIRDMVRLNNSLIHIIGNSAISQIDNDGNPSFTKNFTLPEVQSHTFLSVDNIDGNLLVTGYELTSLSPLILDPLIASFDSQGNLLYHKSYEIGGTYNLLLAAVNYNACNNLFLGYTDKNGVSNPLIIRTGKDGEL